MQEGDEVMTGSRLQNLPMEWLRLASWRAKLRDRLVGFRILEVGVGTGKNLPYYPYGVEVTAIDISPRMLKRARRRADVENSGGRTPSLGRGPLDRGGTLKSSERDSKISE